ncbi:MAG: hypothetical protein OEX82_09010 [Nitrosomonas sp.]|nr:hypothetical protein [Nitrosomonas sp.]
MNIVNRLALSDRLNEDRIDCDINQYLNGSPPEGRPKWVERMLENATRVICTETYLRRVKRKEKTGTGKGVKWESLLAYHNQLINPQA